jgi:chemotaxis protein CheX
MSLPLETAESDDAAVLERWRVVLRESAKEVFSLMVGEEIVDSEQVEAPLEAEITGMVGMAGELCGIMSIRCKVTSGAEIASQMLGVGKEEAAAHAGDAVGEVCNMVAGNFKAKIKGLEDRCMLSVPTVITGCDYQFHTLVVGRRIELPLMFQGKPIWFALELRS